MSRTAPLAKHRLLPIAIALLWAVGWPQAATASHPQPAPDISQMEYTPIGKYGPADEQTLPPGETGSESIPPTNSPLDPTSGTYPSMTYNPSGEYVAYDTNLFETLTLPYRAAGDEAADDPAGNGGNVLYGFCAGGAPDPDGLGPLTAVAGNCPNHQLEYLDYYETTMKEILGDFGVVVKRYPFDSPGNTNTEPGQAYNVAAVVPGADHPDETVLVSGHFDQTTEGPASAWDSAEGHAQVIRMAKVMADYWRATGTRPSATIKFVPWDQEESGTLGSLDYVENNVVPGEEDEVRAYFNVDPCAGAYPAYYRGDPTATDRVPLTLQLVNPADHQDDTEFVERVERFNARAETVVDEVFDNLDDTLTVAPGQERDIYVSDAEAQAAGTQSQRGEIPTTLGGLLLFTSDYRNFENIGVPFFNLSPAFFGPSANGDPNREDGLGILHTPNDNHRTINALTSTDQTGSAVSEGWAKGMELCSQLESWYMLQPEMAGGQTADDDVVAYYEALPNEAVRNEDVAFDASGSYRYTDVGTRQLTDTLTYEWDFGDGTSATGKSVQHSYDAIGVYPSKLTVTDTTTGSTDTMEVPVTVIGSDFAGPLLSPLPEEDEDGTFELAYEYERTEGFREFQIEEASDFQTLLSDDAEDLDAWNVEEPTEEKIEPWQPSDSATPKPSGNLRHGGQRSFWTGVSTPNQQPAMGPGEGVSSLTLKEPVALPAGKASVLSYWSAFANDANDFALVEAAIDEGGPLDWQIVDDFGGEDYATGVPGMPAFEQRSVDLARFAGRRVRLRFSYVLGAPQFVNVLRNGWYVDDIEVTAGTFRAIGTTTENSYTVADRANGTYGYRVKAIFTDGVETAPSNVESVRVTRAAGGSESAGGANGQGGDGQAEDGQSGGGSGALGGGGGVDASPCFRAASSARGNRVGRAGLARRRSSVRGTFDSTGRYRRFVDRYCLLDGGRVRIAYPTPRELRGLSRSERLRVRGESIFVLTTSRSLRIRGVRRGMGIRGLHRRIGRGERVRVGRNLWYFRRGRNSRHIFKVQGGRVRELGIADARLTQGRERAKGFFRQGR